MAGEVRGRMFPWMALIQLGFAVMFFHRPGIIWLYPSYQTFDDMLPLKVWAWWALINAALIGLPLWPDSVRAYVRLVGWLSFATYMMLAAVIFALGIGLNTGSWTYTILAAQGFVQFGQRSAIILNHCGWFQRLKKNPPKWFPVKEMPHGQ